MGHWTSFRSEEACLLTLLLNITTVITIVIEVVLTVVKMPLQDGSPTNDGTSGGKLVVKMPLSSKNAS
jgi:hypothetical protein